MQVWTGQVASGQIAHESDEFIFSYERSAPDAAAVSLTMPISIASYDCPRELHPIFQMNLPEGALRIAAITMFRKALPQFNDLDMLRITGQSQIGRLRYSDGGHLAAMATQSVEEILRYTGTEDLMRSLLERFATASGISGVQPKVMIKDSAIDRLTVSGATHIVKTFDAQLFPELAANEYFCMKVAERAGLAVPRLALSDNGRFLVVERFDLSPDGDYLGLEDFCVLNGLGTARKYETSYENLAKRIGQFVSAQHRRDALHAYFKSLATSCAIRNGDAHLKNFAVLYRDPDSPVTLAPAYDMVCTRAYLPKDSMALTLGGSKRFADGKRLLDFARTHCSMSDAEARLALDEVGQAVSQTKADVMQYMREHHRFEEVGTRILAHFEEGLASAVCLRQR